MTRSNFYIYEHWRLDRDECFYVGKGKGRRAYVVSKRNMHWRAIVAKLSRISSAWEVRIVKSGLTEDDAFKLEIERIEFWKNVGVDLANMTDGGEGICGHVFSSERRAKIVENNKNRSDITRAKLSAAGKGNKHNLGKRPSADTLIKLRNPSAETRAKLAAASKNRKQSGEARNKLKVINTGKKLSEETRNKLSKANVGKKLSEETRNKLRNPPTETRAKISASIKAYWARQKEGLSDG